MSWCPSVDCLFPLGDGKTFLTVYMWSNFECLDTMPCYSGSCSSPIENGGVFFGVFFLVCNWTIFALQYCVGFCHFQHESAKGIHMPRPGTSSPSPSLQVVTKPLILAPYLIQWISTSYLFYILQCICFHAALSIHPTLFFPDWVHKRLFSMSAYPLLPCKQVHQYHLSRLHIYALIYGTCLSLSDPSHYV